MACLVLKEFTRLDYRGFAEHPADHPDLAGLIGLKVIPHYATFQKAAARRFKATPARVTFDAVPARALKGKVRKRRVPLAAVDGTGMESRHVGRSYVKRRSKTGTGTQETTYARYPKAVLVTDRRTRLVLAAVAGRGPASDLVLFEAALKQAVGEAAGREVASADEAAVRQGEVRSAVADGDGQFDGQATAGLGAACAELLEPVPRDHHSSYHT